MTTKHTPGPWRTRIAVADQGQPLVIYPPDGNLRIAKICINKGEETMQANAQFIVQACNSHDELLEACKLAQKYVAKMVADDVQTAMPPQVALNRIEQAINKAEGKDQPLPCPFREGENRS